MLFTRSKMIKIQDRKKKRKNSDIQRAFFCIFQDVVVLVEMMKVIRKKLMNFVKKKRTSRNIEYSLELLKSWLNFLNDFWLLIE